MYQFKKYCTGSKNNVKPVQEQIVPKEKLNYNIFTGEVLLFATYMYSFPRCKTKKQIRKLVSLRTSYEINVKLSVVFATMYGVD